MLLCQSGDECQSTADIIDMPVQSTSSKLAADKTVSDSPFQFNTFLLKQLLADTSSLASSRMSLTNLYCSVSSLEFLYVRSRHLLYCFALFDGI